MIFRAALHSLLFALVSLPAFAAESKKAAEEEVQIVEGVNCKHEKNTKDERRLEAQTHGKGCILVYTKYGKAQQIGKAVNGVELCREKLRGVRATLEKGGYKCE